MTNTFWERFEQIRAESKERGVGKRMVAEGFDVVHTGGGCLCWEKNVAHDHYLWVCDVNNDLGQSLNEPYLVGFYDQDATPLFNDEVASLESAIDWCRRMEAMHLNAKPWTGASAL